MNKDSVAEFLRLEDAIETIKAQLVKALDVDHELRHTHESLCRMLERLQSGQRELEAAKDQWTAAFDAIVHPVFLHDAEYRIVRCNRAYLAKADVAAEEVLGKRYWEVFPPGNGPLPGCAHALQEGCNRGESKEEVRLEGGETLLSHSYVICDHDGHYLYSIHILHDITAEVKAARRVETLRGVIEDLSVQVDVDRLGEKALSAALGLTGADIGAVALVESASGQLACRWWQGFPADLPGDDLVLTLDQPDNQPPAWISGEAQIVSDCSAGGYPGCLGPDVKSAMGVPIFVAGRVEGVMCVGSREKAKQFQREEVPLLEAIARQVGVALQRERLTNDLSASERRFRRVVETVPDILYTATLPDFRFTFVSPAVRGLLGVAPDELVESPGAWLRRVHAEDRDRLLSARAEALARGEDYTVEYRCLDGQGRACCWVLDHGSLERDASGAPTSVSGVMTDITGRKRAEEEADHHWAQLCRGMEQMVESLAKAMEARDAYTAGHQRRVTELAVAIAEELQFDIEQVKALRMAALVHDVGKIHVPAEILSKPAILNPLEFELVKMHPKVGYDILKSVEFPGPVAEIVLQHHERVDGSGYPNGLVGEAILPEAKVLAVADVVESMSMHRPYRAAIGLSNALEEIARQRGSGLDARAVDACLRLFKDKGWGWEPAEPPELCRLFGEVG